MERDCYRIEELGEISELPDGDPRRAHLAECAHCSALVAAVREFRDPSAMPAGARPQDAALRLRGLVDHKLGLSDLPSGEGVDPRRRRDARSPRHPWLSSLWRPPLRPAWGLAAACLVVVGFLTLVRHQSETPGPIVTRNAQPHMGHALLLHPARALPAGQILLSWEPVEGADGYEVLLLDTNLTVRERLPAGSDPTASVEGDRLRELFGDRQSILWQVRALRGGDELLHSPPERLQVP
jgi:hypothetical protein